MPVGFTLLTTWLQWDFDKLPFWHRHCEQQMFSNDLFWSVLFNTSQFFAFSIIGSVSYSHSPQPPSQKTHSSHLIFWFQNNLSCSSPILFSHKSHPYSQQHCFHPNSLTSFTPIIFPQFLQSNPATLPLSPSISSYSATPVPICFPKPPCTT